ncbi:MAG: pyridoxamine 5'-phosphate oxidase family protein [Solirubrobacteraceae bacterium]
MASWRDIEAAAPEFAAAARAFLDAHQHKTIATLRRNGAPRISGTEATFVDGDLWWGSMPNAIKAADLQRDPRFALHSASADPPAWKGDAKVSGRAVEVQDRVAAGALVRAQGNDPGDAAFTDFHLFRADISEVALVRLAESGDRLIIESWAEGRTPAVRRIER